jgi:hypothetical protein
MNDNDDISEVADGTDGKFIIVCETFAWNWNYCRLDDLWSTTPATKLL